MKDTVIAKERERLWQSSMVFLSPIRPMYIETNGFTILPIEGELRGVLFTAHSGVF